MILKYTAFEQLLADFLTRDFPYFILAGDLVLLKRFKVK